MTTKTNKKPKLNDDLDEMMNEAYRNGRAYSAFLALEILTEICNNQEVIKEFRKRIKFDD